jgi:hypothetical protein
MVNCSSWVSRSPSPRYRSTWCPGEIGRCRPGRPSFQMEGIASIDLFVVPTIASQQLFAFLVLGHERRRMLWFAVTRNPTAEWLARQITEAFPWDSKPKYLLRDNDRARSTYPFCQGVSALPSRLACERWGSGTDVVPFGRLDPSRVHGSSDCVQRGTPSADCCRIRRLLQ